MQHAALLTGDAHVNQVSGFQELIGSVEAGPGPVLGRQQELALPDAARNLVRQQPSDQGVHVASRSRGYIPVRMLESVHVQAARKHIEKMALPAAAAFPGSETIENRPIRRVLQVQIERGVNLQAGGVNFFSAEAPLQLAAHLFHEPRSDGIRRSLQMQPQWRRARSLRLRRRDLAVLKHGVDDDVPPAERPVGVQQRRKFHGSLRQTS